MPHPLRWRMRRLSLLAVAALAAGLCLLAPATAAARHRARLESAVSEETVTSALQEPTTEEPATETPAAETPAEPPASTPPVEPAPSESTTNSRRRTRREARRARRTAVSAAGCTVDLQATPSVITDGSPLSLTGTLSCPEAASAAAQTVTLYQKLTHTAGFNITATATTEANGAFQFAPGALEDNSVFYVRCDGTKSTRISVAVSPQVTISTPAAGAQLLLGSARASRASAENGSAVTFTGTVSPADPGATISLQREYRTGAWHRIGGGGRVNDEGAYSIFHTFFRPGEAHIRVVVHSRRLKTTASAPVTYHISRTRHAPVTIGSSADPVAYGLPVTISGTVAGALNQPVTLLAQMPDGTFTPIAEATTSGDEYSFVESPLLSTDYRVRSAGASSAILSQGVTYALTATPSASTVQAGGQLSFTGTVTPAHEGQLVDLERENTSGVGYSVIAVGAVSSTSAYSITQTFAAVGTELLRISVPAEPGFETVAGEALTIEVTAAS
jgi:hypothetical protein